MTTNQPNIKQDPKFNEGQFVFYINHILNQELLSKYEVQLSQGLITEVEYKNGVYYYSVRTKATYSNPIQSACICKSFDNIPEYLIFEEEYEACDYFAHLIQKLDNFIHEGIQFNDDITEGQNQ